jgi:hypothetical protein
VHFLACRSWRDCLNWKCAAFLFGIPDVWNISPACRSFELNCVVVFSLRDSLDCVYACHSGLTFADVAFLICSKNAGVPVFSGVVFP